MRDASKRRSERLRVRKLCRGCEDGACVWWGGVRGIEGKGLRARGVHRKFGKGATKDAIKSAGTIGGNVAWVDGKGWDCLVAYLAT